jgi:sugar O-acyltransferase (sialic acid O-acetyltransferase NeuD family)
MASPLILVGTLGLGQEVLQAARSTGSFELLGFVDDNETLRGEVFDGVKVLGGLDVLGAYPDAQVVLCAGRGTDRRTLSERLAFPDGRYASVVHSNATVSGSSILAPGTILLAGSVLTSDVALGRHVVIMPNVCLTHDDVVEDYATLCAGVIVGGRVRIERGAYIGMNASVRERCVIGAEVVIGMGSVVLNDVPAGQVWMGVPATHQVSASKVIGPLSAQRGPTDSTHPSGDGSGAAGFGTRLPKVSVAISSFNYGRFLRDCIQSALSQPGVDLDVVVVDDASTDDSVEIAEQFAAADPRVRVIAHATNQGHIATFNEALAAVRGDYVVKLDSDDMLAPDALARAADVFERNPSVGLVYGNPLTFTDEIPADSRALVSGVKIWPGHEWNQIRLRKGRNCIMQPEAMVRTSVLQQVGSHRTTTPGAHDLNLWMRIATVSDVARIKGADQGFYRVHDGSLLHTQFAGLLSDLTERGKAFNDFLDTYTGPADDVPAMRQRVTRALAVEALEHASREFDTGAFHAARVEAYIEFATTTYPDVRHLRQWAALARRRRLGPERSSRYLPYRLCETMHDVRDRVRWRMWNRYGV